MAYIYLQSFKYPSPETSLNVSNHNMYLDDSTNEFVGIDETTGDEVFRIPSGNSGWIKLVFDLTQDDIRNWNIANDGYGFKMFDAQGANKIVQINNGIIKFEQTGGTYPQGTFVIYSGKIGEILSVDNSKQVVPASPSDTVYIFTDKDNTTTQAGALQTVNDTIYLYGSPDTSDYEGTAKLIVDYRVIDFS